MRPSSPPQTLRLPSPRLHASLPSSRFHAHTDSPFAVCPSLAAIFAHAFSCVSSKGASVTISTIQRDAVSLMSLTRLDSCLADRLADRRTRQPVPERPPTPLVANNQRASAHPSYQQQSHVQAKFTLIPALSPCRSLLLDINKPAYLPSRSSSWLLHANMPISAPQPCHGSRGSGLDLAGLTTCAQERHWGMV